MKIAPNQFNISQLFSTTNEQFFIPAYQRRYAWGEKQLGELLDDIKLLKENENHLLSTIVLLTDLHSAGINRLEVVDGQQRLTTLSILFLTLKEKFKLHNDEESIKEIDAFLKCRDIHKAEYSKVLLGDLDNPDYEKLYKNSELELIKNTNLKSAFEFYLKHLPENHEDLNQFFFKLKNNTLIIRLDVSFAKDAYRLFESINNRGLRLSATDIIKNFILGNASLVSDDILSDVRNHWKNLIISLDGIVADNFFRQYLSGILSRKITVSKVIEEFKKYYFKNVDEAKLLSEYSMFYEESTEVNEDELEDKTIKEITTNPEVNNEEESENGENGSTKEIEKSEEQISIVKFTRRLSETSEIYSKIVKRRFDNKKINQHLFNLQRIKSLPSYTFLLNMFQRNLDEKEILRILKLIESFMLKRHICEYRTSELDDIFPKLVNLSDENLFNDVKAELLLNTPTEKEFISKLIHYNFKGNIERAKYILEMIEYYLIKDQGEYILSGGQELHLEHIIPQKIKTKRSKEEFGDWESYLGDDAIIKHKEYVNTIGNYTLIAEKLNIKASNNPFLAKKREYKKSNLMLNKILVKEYSRFRFKMVEKRAKWLADMAATIWRI